MSVASLREALEREIAVRVMAGGEPKEIGGAGTDLIDFGGANINRHYWTRREIFREARFGLLAEHLPGGAVVLADMSAYVPAGVQLYERSLLRMLVSSPYMLSDDFLEGVLRGDVLDP